MSLASIWAAAMLLLASDNFAPTGERQVERLPQEGRYAFLSTNENEAGGDAQAYVSAPFAASGDQVSAWLVDVFAKPLKMPRGKGAYAGALYRYDCRRGLARVERGDLFDAEGRIIDSYDMPTRFDALPESAQTRKMMTLACDPAPDAFPIRGVSDMRADARGRADAPNV